MRLAGEFCTLAGLLLGCAVQAADFVPPKIDGRLGDPVWQDAVWRKGETCEWTFRTDAKTLYLAARCRVREPEMVDFAFAPGGTDFSVYRFRFPSGGQGSADYVSEGGNIRPDPFAPAWTRACGEEKGVKTIEAAIPLSAFYMTRNDGWRTVWLVGEGRTLVRETGFPQRSADDDVMMGETVSRATVLRDGQVEATLETRVYVARAGEYALNGTAAVLTAGWNDVRFTQKVKREGLVRVPLKLVRTATGETYERTYPVRLDCRPIRVRFTKPGYRTNFYPGQNADSVEGVVETADGSEAELRLEGPGFPVRTCRVRNGGTFAFDTRGFQVGAATLSVASASTNRTITVRRLAPSARQMSWIEDGKIVVNGRKTFVRRVYGPYYRGGRAFDEWWRREQPKFHETTNRTDRVSVELWYLNLPKGFSQKEELKDDCPSPEVFAAIDRRLEECRDRDFLCYYLNDEPECRNVSPVYLRYIYEYVREKDPYHLVLMASRAPDLYIDSCDWFEAHPYLNPHNEKDGTRRYERRISSIGSWMDRVTRLGRPDKAIGLISTCFAYRGQDIANDYPTFPEYDCHIWAALVRGAVSLWPYAYYDLGDRPSICEGTRYVFASTAALEDILVEARRRTLLSGGDCEATLFDKGDGRTKLLAVVNFKSAPLAVDFAPFVAAAGGGRLFEFRGNRTFGPKTGEIRLNPFEVVLATTEKRGADLPTFAETQGRVDRLEYERTHRDNQLLERHQDVELATSSRDGNPYKIIDGVRGVLAWRQDWKDRPFVEFGARRGKFTFSKLRVYGTGFSTVEVEIRRDGAWVPLEGTVTAKTRYRCELDFGKVVSTVRLRVICPASKSGQTRPEVELYEVELPYAKGASSVKASSAKAKGARPVREAWRVDGSTKGWTVPEHARPRPDGGFIASGELNLRVTVPPGYRWFEAAVDDFKAIRGGYLSWSVYLWNKFGYQFGVVQCPQPGIFTQRLPEVTEPVQELLRIYDYNFDISFRYLRLVDEPENWLLFEPVGDLTEVGPGDTVHVEMKLAEPCEEVSAKFLRDPGTGGGNYPYLINASPVVPMKRLDKAGCRWGADVKIESCKPAKKGQVCVRATTLGGGPELPLFSKIKASFRDK